MFDDSGVYFFPATLNKKQTNCDSWISEFHISLIFPQFTQPCKVSTYLGWCFLFFVQAALSQLEMENPQLEELIIQV